MGRIAMGRDLNDVDYDDLSDVDYDAAPTKKPKPKYGLSSGNALVDIAKNTLSTVPVAASKAGESMEYAGGLPFRFLAEYADRKAAEAAEQEKAGMPSWATGDISPFSVLGNTQLVRDIAEGSKKNLAAHRQFQEEVLPEMSSIDPNSYAGAVAGGIGSMPAGMVQFNPAMAAMSGYDQGGDLGALKSTLLTMGAGKVMDVLQGNQAMWNTLNEFAKKMGIKDGVKAGNIERVLTALPSRQIGSSAVNMAQSYAEGGDAAQVAAAGTLGLVIPSGSEKTTYPVKLRKDEVKAFQEAYGVPQGVTTRDKLVTDNQVINVNDAIIQGLREGNLSVTAPSGEKISRTPRNVEEQMELHSGVVNKEFDKRQALLSSAAGTGVNVDAAIRPVQKLVSIINEMKPRTIDPKVNKDVNDIFQVTGLVSKIANGAESPQLLLSAADRLDAVADSFDTYMSGDVYGQTAQFMDETLKSSKPAIRDWVAANKAYFDRTTGLPVDSKAAKPERQGLPEKVMAQFEGAKRATNKAYGNMNKDLGRSTPEEFPDIANQLTQMGVEQTRNPQGDKLREIAGQIRRIAGNDGEVVYSDAVIPQLQKLIRGGKADSAFDRIIEDTINDVRRKDVISLRDLYSMIQEKNAITKKAYKLIDTTLATKLEADAAIGDAYRGVMAESLKKTPIGLEGSQEFMDSGRLISDVLSIDEHVNDKYRALGGRTGRSLLFSPVGNHSISTPTLALMGAKHLFTGSPDSKVRQMYKHAEERYNFERGGEAKPALPVKTQTPILPEQDYFAPRSQSNLQPMNLGQYASWGAMAEEE
jgi:hypothetical protein